MKSEESSDVLPRRNPSSTSIEAAAADWIARRNGGLEPREETQLGAWLAADPRHAAAFAEYEATWAQLTAPNREGLENPLLEELNRRSHRRRRRRLTLLFGSVGLAAAAMLVIAFGSFASKHTGSSTANSIVLAPDLRTLPDGSVVELNAGAEIAVNFTATQRGVRLLRGEALFAVAHNPAIPFVVTAGEVDVYAVGTAFSVRHDPDDVTVLVSEGRVRVERNVADPAPAGQDVQSLYLDANREVVVPTDLRQENTLKSVQLSTTELTDALAWRTKRVEFTDTTLSDAVTLFNRCNRLQLSIAAPELSERRITGIFWSDDPKGFVRLIESALNLRAEKSGNSIRLLPRQG